MKPEYSQELVDHYKRTIKVGDIVYSDLLNAAPAYKVSYVGADFLVVNSEASQRECTISYNQISLTCTEASRTYCERQLARCEHDIQVHTHRIAGSHESLVGLQAQREALLARLAQLDGQAAGVGAVKII